LVTRIAVISGSGIPAASRRGSLLNPGAVPAAVDDYTVPADCAGQRGVAGDSNSPPSSFIRK
jgi:hypothetical protein